MTLCDGGICRGLYDVVCRKYVQGQSSYDVV